MASGITSVEAETTRLLSEGPSTEQDDIRQPAPRFLQKDVVLCMLVYFFHSMNGFLPIGPFLFLYERSICYRYYLRHDPSKIGLGHTVDEFLCKLEPIQRELAVVRAWEGAFEAIPGISVWDYLL